MGCCQSRQPAVVIGDDDLRKRPKVQAPLDRSLTPGTAPEPSEPSESHSHHNEITADVPPVSSIPPNESSQGPTHTVRKMNNALVVKDYLQAEGPSKNRMMVHIETPLGLPIEEVYDGVHTGEVLGEGIAGKVRIITHRDTGIQRAVKRLDLEMVTRDEDLNHLLDEIKIMCCLDHPNVVCLEEVFEGENELFLTQELCRGGDLFDRLDQQPNYCYTEAMAARLIKQIIGAVSYLHSKDIIHRDLKLENFLFQDETDESELILIDFGLSKHLVKGEVSHEAVGTPYTVAPEVILEKGYDEKCDVWGIGVLAYLLLSGDTPFGGADPGENLLQVRQNILSGQVSFEDPVWHAVSPLAINFIKSLLVLNPAERPSASKLVEHPWLKAMKRISSLGSEESGLNTKVVDGLISFKELSTTRKFLCEVISYTLQPDQISGLHEEFEKIDVEGTGEISLQSFKEALISKSNQHPLTEEEIEDIFNGIKVRNTDFSIRWHEFIAACLSQCHIDDRNIKLAFERLDNEHKGFVTLDDLKEAMDFYGSDRVGLQSMWINNVIDYKSNKQNMTYDDFYKLLNFDKDREYGSPVQPLTSSTQTRQTYPFTRHASTGTDASADLVKIDGTAPMGGPSSKSQAGWSRRQTLGPGLNLDMKPSLICDVKASRDIHNLILDASKRAEEEKKNRTYTRRNSITGQRGLFLRRESTSSTSSPVRVNSHPFVRANSHT